MWWFAQSQFQTITDKVLQDNEYYDVESGQKQDPYTIKMGSTGKTDAKKNDKVEEETWAMTSDDLKEVSFYHFNSARRTISAGEQIFYNYGNNKNGYLMLQYGFCFPSNKFDSFELRMKLDMSIQDHNISDLIDFDLKSRSIQKIFLKHDQLNLTLIAYLRSLLKQQFYPKVNQLISNTNAMQNIFLMQEVMISTPTDLLYEKHVLDHYLQILAFIGKKINDTTTLDEDLEMLEKGTLSNNMRMAITYRSEQKKIIKSQINIVSKTLEVLNLIKSILT